MTALRALLDDYLAIRRGSGFKLQRDGKLLPRFIDFLEAEGAAHVTVHLAHRWSTQPAGANPKWWARRLLMVRQFARYAKAFDPLTELPASDLIPYRAQRATPYIYSDADIDSLLAAARALPGPLRPATYATLLGLLAVTGLRVNEALRLERNDVDLDAGMLRIRYTKFGKSRDVPVLASTAEALQAYARERDRYLGRSRTASFFVSHAGTPVFHSNLHFAFFGLVRAAGLADRKPRRPRIHDLRHTFIVKTLTDWYRAGLEIAPRMPLLSTYVGHVGPDSTYWYITATPELLALANQRAERTLEATS